MKYKLEVENGRSVETLTVNGKEYVKEGVYKGNGITSFDEDFSEMLEADGFDNEDILDMVWDVLDSEFTASNIIKMCGMDT